MKINQRSITVMLGLLAVVSIIIPTQMQTQTFASTDEPDVLNIREVGNNGNNAEMAKMTVKEGNQPSEKEDDFELDPEENAIFVPQGKNVEVTNDENFFRAIVVQGDTDKQVPINQQGIVDLNDLNQGFYYFDVVIQDGNRKVAYEAILYVGDDNDQNRDTVNKEVNRVDKDVTITKRITNIDKTVVCGKDQKFNDKTKKCENIPPPPCKPGQTPAKDKCTPPKPPTKTPTPSPGGPGVLPPIGGGGAGGVPVPCPPGRFTDAITCVQLPSGLVVPISGFKAPDLIPTDPEASTPTPTPIPTPDQGIATLPTTPTPSPPTPDDPDARLFGTGPVDQPQNPDPLRGDPCPPPNEDQVYPNCPEPPTPTEPQCTPPMVPGPLPGMCVDPNNPPPTPEPIDECPPGQVGFPSSGPPYDYCVPEPVVPCPPEAPGCPPATPPPTPPVDCEENPDDLSCPPPLDCIDNPDDPRCPKDPVPCIPGIDLPCTTGGELTTPPEDDCGEDEIWNGVECVEDTGTDVEEDPCAGDDPPDYCFGDTGTGEDFSAEDDDDVVQEDVQEDAETENTGDSAEFESDEE